MIRRNQGPNRWRAPQSREMQMQRGDDPPTAGAAAEAAGSEGEDDLADRRQVLELAMRLGAAGAMITVLFDPRRAAADVTGELEFEE